MRPLAIASLICGIAILGEALFMGKLGGQFMKTLKQPSFAPPAWVWAVVGAGYYAVCFFVLLQLTSGRSGSLVQLAMLITLMSANTFWNFIYFRLRNLRLVFWYSVVYSGLALIVLTTLIRFDERAALIFSIYVAYLPYALMVFYRTWKLNPALRGKAL